LPERTIAFLEWRSLPRTPAESYPLEPDRATLASWLETFAARRSDAVERLPVTSAAGRVGAEGTAIGDAISRAIPEEPPFPGGAPELAALVLRASRGRLNTAGPGYLAYIPGGGLPATAIADLVAGLLNRYTGLTAAAPRRCGWNRT
jgi:aromatic-L-amino-acid decarboxylase